MKETYLSRDFRETAAQCFPSQAKELNAFFDARLNVLLAENADAINEFDRLAKINDGILRHMIVKRED